VDFVNESKVPAGWTLGFERDGRELVVVATKVTFMIPTDGGDPLLAEEQAKLTEADLFTGEPGLSAPRYESDFAHRKPMCDVLINARAYAPDGRATRQMAVGARVGQMMKTFAVTGNRVWVSGLVRATATDPEPFVVMNVSYDNAFGGVDDSKKDPQNVKTYLENPVGRGYSYFKQQIDGQRLPNTEELRKPVENPSGHYRPMSFGPVGRSWQPRARFAGTYDQRWLDRRSPFWPDDFDYRYFQAAPADQQIPHPTGGEEVVLSNLTPNGHVKFGLPTLAMPVLFVPHRGRAEEVRSVIDTILIEPDLGRFMLTCRVSYPMRKSCFDLKRVVVGESLADWFRRERFRGKPYYKSLGELVKARRR
jgi:hypothetical protein